jgi:DHA2 family metal-tetracycline-proton antiporter-like MFS transporter
MEDNKNADSITPIIPICIGVFLANLDGSIVNIALPTLLKDFNVDMSTVSIVVISYLLAMSCFLLLFGKLSDIKGPKKMFMAGFVVFLFSSLLCTFATGIYMLSFFRFIQGIGSSILASTFGALILHYLSPNIRGRAFGLTAVAGGTGFALGSPLGGLIIKYLSWKWIFYINIPLCLIAIFMAYRFLPEKNLHRPHGSGIDIISVILSFICLCAVNIAMNRLNTEGWKSLFILLSVIIFLLTLFLFIYRQMKIPSPLMDMNIFKNRGLSAGLIAAFLSGLILSGSMFLFPFYFEFVRNFNSARTGMFLMVMPLLSTLLGPLAGYLSDRYGPRSVILYSTFLMIISIIMISMFNSVISTYYIIISFIVFGTALAFFLTANISLIMGYAPKGKEGITSALAGLNGALSASTGISIFAAIFSYYLADTGASGNTMNPSYVIKGFHICFICFIVLAVLIFITTLLIKEKRRFTTKLLKLSNFSVITEE